MLSHMVVKLSSPNPPLISSLRVVLSHMVVKPLTLYRIRTSRLRVVLSHMVVKRFRDTRMGQ